MTTTHTTPATTTPDGTHAARPILLIACGATFLAFLDASVVNMAFGALATSFPSTTQSALTWVVSAYAVAFASGLAVGGRAADVLGHRSLLLTGTLLFAIASVVCALAPTAGWLIGARAVQGFGAAMLLPAALAALLAAVPPARTSAAIGAWGASAALAAAIGPSVGAGLVDLFGWPAIFFVNLPACAALAFATVVAVPTPAVGQRTSLPDLLGAALLAGGTAAVVAAATESHTWGYTSAATLGLTGVGLACVAVTVWRSRIHPQPVFALVLWRRRGFAGANLLNAALGAGLFAHMLALPMWMTVVWRMTLLQAAAAIGLAGVAAIIGAALVGRFATADSARWFAAAGMGSIALEFLALATPLWGQTRAWSAWCALAVLVGCGVGAAISAASVVTATAIPLADTATGMGMTLTSRQIGGALGVAVLAAILAETTSPSFIDSFHTLFTVLAAVSALAALSAPWLLTTSRTPIPVRPEPHKPSMANRGPGTTTPDLYFDRPLTVTARDGLPLAATETGSAASPMTVVYVHGILADRSFWDPVVDHLSPQLGRRATQFRYDVRGHGNSGWPARRSRTRVTVLADDLADVLDQVYGPVVLVGHSFAGYVLLEYARLYPEQLAARVAGMVLFNAAGELPAWSAMRRFQRLSSRIEWMRATPLDRINTWAHDRMAARLQSMASDAKPGRAQLIPSQYGIDPRVTSDITADLSRFALDDQVPAALASLPVHVIAGQYDRVFTHDQTLRLAAALPGAHLDVISDAGHSLPLARPEAAAEIVLAAVDYAYHSAVAGVRR